MKLRRNLAAFGAHALVLHLSAILCVGGLECST